MNRKKKIRHIAQSNRITRRCLIGTGIVSGLEINLDAQQHICVQAGKGVSSDGKYIEISGNLVFTFYREFEFVGEYPFFFYEDGGQIPLWKLVTDDEFSVSDQALSPQYQQEKLNPFLKDKVVLLYFEHQSPQKQEEIPEEEELLLSKEETGDEQGQHAKHITHFLLARQEDILQKMDIQKLSTLMVWKRLEDDEDFIYSDAFNPNDDKPTAEDVNKAKNPALRLPEIPLRRFGFSKGDPYDCPPGGPDQSEFPEIKNLHDIYKTYRPCVDEAISDLYKALNDLFRYYEPLIDKYPTWDVAATFDAMMDKWDAFKSKNKNEGSSVHKEYIQYFYDWMRDLLAAYHDLRKRLIDYTFLSLSGADEFPNHFLLGQPLRETVTNVPQPFRQHFKHPPVFNGQADRLNSIRLYFWRLMVMIKNFYLPGYIEESKMNFCNTPHEDPEQEPVFDRLKVTPGRFYDKPVELQTIPYYYYPVARHRYSLHHFWNYERTRNSTADEILCYHANDSEESYTGKLHIIRPLHYNLDPYDFFRIEGHIGQPFAETHLELRNIKHKYNLDFNIVGVKLSEATPLTAFYKTFAGGHYWGILFISAPFFGNGTHCRCTQGRDIYYCL